jgi:hypothetical protein
MHGARLRLRPSLKLSLLSLVAPTVDPPVPSLHPRHACPLPSPLPPASPPACVPACVKSLLKDPGPHLVVVPASLLENWQRELAAWAPNLK